MPMLKGLLLSINVVLIKETRKAILIEFDGQKAWLPKAWVIKIGKYRHCEAPSGFAQAKLRAEAISIKISLYNWTKKFS